VRALGPAAVATRRDDEAVPEAAATIRSFVDGHRLMAIPARRSKRRIVLDLLAQDFEPGVRYSELEVNRRLRRWHPDVAALRRYLVEEGLMDRAGGCGDYWRAGGTFMVDE
jgi:hypothetical protein